MPSVPLLVLLAVTLLCAVWFDVRARRIPDFLTWPAMGVALLMRLWGDGLGEVLDVGLLSGVAGLAAAAAWFGAFAYFSKGGFGWGDVKLAAAIGAVCGVPLIFTAVACISLVGALQAGAQLFWGGKSATKAGLPYAVAMALGTVWAIWWQR